MGNIYKMTGEILKGDPYIGVCNSSIETAERLCMLQDYCQTMHSTGIKQALGMNRCKRNGYKLKRCTLELCNNQATDQFRQNCHSKHQIKSRSGQDQLICVQEVDSEVGK